MYIHEAISEAMATGRCIRRKAPAIWKRCKVEPTDSDEGCLLLSAFSMAPCPRWQPKAEDLMAGDWMLSP